MNQFANTQNSGLLKDYYDDENKRSPLELALKKKREKLAETKIGLDPEGE